MTVVRWGVRFLFASGFIVALALFLGYAPAWSGLVILALGGALVAIYIHRLET